MKHIKRVQIGAAMVEFIVASIFFLVPLYLAVQALGKFADVQSTTNNAARYVAWEKTVWYEDTSTRFYDHNKPNKKSTAAIKNELSVRVLNDRRSSFKYSNSDKGATTYANGIDPLWQDTGGKDYLDDFARVTATNAYEKPSRDILGDAIDLINKVSVPSIVGTLAPPVPSETLAVADVKLNKISEKSEVYKRLWSKSAGLSSDWVGLDFTGKGAILSNTWAANSSTGTKAMVADSVPTANGLGTAVQAAALVTLGLWDPIAVSGLDMGRIAVDVVPDDRLK